ncbi:MAG: DUF1573 domain-containing protein [Dysgonamonadaceae bacterium]|jgi:hypothetical protein|nr:DUF1573 domain-containing protein [Dysgonamonadaceae bacterium]
MKKMFLLVMVSVFGLAGNAQAPDATIVFKTTTHDFGEIRQGEPQTFSFEFTNSGTEPVLIQNVRSSCGCTASAWTKEPVESGQKGRVQATYNAAIVGPFSKTLTVTYSGSDKSIVLYVKGTVQATEK